MTDYPVFKPSYFVRNFKDPVERCHHLPNNTYPYNDPAYTPYVDPRFHDPNYHRSAMPQMHSYSGPGCGYTRNGEAHSTKTYKPCGGYRVQNLDLYGKPNKCPISAPKRNCGCSGNH